MGGHATKWGVFAAHFWGAFTGRLESRQFHPKSPPPPNDPRPPQPKPKFHHVDGRDLAQRFGDAVPLVVGFARRLLAKMVLIIALTAGCCLAGT